MTVARCRPALPEKSLLLLLLLTLSCSSTGPGSSGTLPTATLLVTNATCTAGQCAPLQVLGFPSNQPHTPGGFWSLDLGLVTGASACLTLPASGAFRVVDASTGRTTTYTWTVGDPLALSGEPAPADRIHAGPDTGPFVPVNAPGWSIVLPGGTVVSAAAACTP